MEHIPGYDAWKTTPPDDPEPVEHCDICGVYPAAVLIYSTKLWQAVCHDT